jgi:hypothetical protein
MSLTNYNGLQIPSTTPTGDGGYAISKNFQDLIVWNPKSNWAGTSNPTTSNNQSGGGYYYPGSFWLNMNMTEQFFLCLSSSSITATGQQIPLLQTGTNSARTATYPLGTFYWTTDDKQLWMGDGSTAGGNLVGISPGSANTWTAAQTFDNSDIILLGSSTGGTTFESANTSATNYTLTFPAVTDTLAVLGTAQTFTAAQTIGSVVYASGTPSSSNFTVGTSGNNMIINVPSGKQLHLQQNGSDILYFDNSGILWCINDTLVTANISAWGGAIIENFNVFSTNPFPNIGGFIAQSSPATSVATIQNTAPLQFRGQYWNGTSSIGYGSTIYWIQDSTTPTGHLSFNLNNNGTITEIAKLDQTGNFATNGNVNIAAAQTTLSGATSGTVVWSQPFQGSSYKKFIAYFNAYENDTATNQTITFTTAFTQTPIIVSNSTGLTISTTASTVTITAPNNISTFSGWLIIEGY